MPCGLVLPSRVVCLPKLPHHPHRVLQRVDFLSEPLYLECHAKSILSCLAPGNLLHGLSVSAIRESQSCRPSFAAESSYLLTRRCIDGKFMLDLRYSIVGFRGYFLEQLVLLRPQVFHQQLLDGLSMRLAWCLLVLQGSRALRRQYFEEDEMELILEAQRLDAKLLAEPLDFSAVAAQYLQRGL